MHEDTWLAPVTELRPRQQVSAEAEWHPLPSDVGQSAVNSDREDAVAEAEERALRSLRRSQKSVDEVRRDLLRDDDVTEEEAEHIIERLTGFGYLNDARLAEDLVAKHGDGKGVGVRGLERLLADRRIPRELIEETLAERNEYSSESERAFAIASERARKLAGLDEETAKRRLLGYVQRRGYSSGVALAAVERALRPGPRSGGRPGRSGVSFVPSED